MVINPQQPVVVLFLALVALVSRVAGDDRALSQADDLLRAFHQRQPHDRLVREVFQRQSDSELAELVVESPSLSLRLRAVEELAIRRGDVHPCDSFLELLETALDVPPPSRFRRSVRNGHVVDGQILPRIGLRPLNQGVRGDGWSVSRTEAYELTVLVGSYRQTIKTTSPNALVAATSDNNTIVCVLHNALWPSEPACLAFSSQSGQELWQRTGRAGSNTPGGSGLLSNDTEVVVQGDRVYLFGACSAFVYMECYSLSNGAVVGMYRSPPTSDENADH